MATETPIKPKPASKPKQVKAMTPTQLAEKLAGKDSAERVAKAFVRPYLRRHFARAKDAKGTSWNLNAAQVKAVTEAYKKRHSTKA